MTTEELPPTFGVLALIGGGNVLHVIDSETMEEVAPTSHDAGGHDGRAACGAHGRLRNIVRDVDARAIRHEGRPVCGNCRTQVARRTFESPVRGVAAAALEAHSATVTAASKPRKETAMKGTAKIEKLRAERTSINNKLSGLNTQLKRVTGTPREKARKPEINKRIKELTARREAIGAELQKLEEPDETPAATLQRVAARGSSTRAAKGRRAKTPA
jgi:cell division protein FtsB